MFTWRHGTSQTGRLEDSKSGGGHGGGDGGGGGGSGVASACPTGGGVIGEQAFRASDSVGDCKSPHIPVGQCNSASSVSSFHSTGGPMSFVPTPLIAESFCHIARASG